MAKTEKQCLISSYSSYYYLTIELFANGSDTGKLALLTLILSITILLEPLQILCNIDNKVTILFLHCIYINLMCFMIEDECTITMLVDNHYTRVRRMW